MKISILTLFPNLISNYISESIIKRAILKNKVELEVIDIREHTTYDHKQVDDYQFGGGAGMLLMIEPVVRALNSIKTKESFTILTSPQGVTLNNYISRELSIKHKHIILICGHYEGIDARIMNYVDMELSIGDYVITGGELSSLVIADSIIRLIDGVIAKESHENDSFENNLLDYDSYTKPVEFDGHKVPEVLISGHHKNINNFRRESQLKNTFNKRNDLLKKAKLSSEDQMIIEKLKRGE
ncbi:tRNA (guanine-N(1)-)-methyltransferase [Spiroplasma sp. TIUS-1]|uniref:tRNA (guanosine(37)-N1)-methyltransferase TrmD n=1 Tax=Spiroplasma sp. TIUS-1 TaxID=216963 RepID=UPI00139765D8|nr:tRNA (guanosine(37)-N1)-methyltransferase TrmD [Spiroplasma sp. TIUS-1]QHX35852.1 tRNA (guanine-N(1)-)-methyltransferase [Spiroplasma sp. TIUS-1]